MSRFLRLDLEGIYRVPGERTFTFLQRKCKCFFLCVFFLINRVPGKCFWGVFFLVSSSLPGVMCSLLKMIGSLCSLLHQNIK